jgi:hypothetical protein
MVRHQQPWSSSPTCRATAEFTCLPRCPPARCFVTELARAPPAHTALRRCRARPCTACSHCAAPSPSLPACRAVSSPCSPLRRAAAELARAPPARTVPRRRRARPRARLRAPRHATAEFARLPRRLPARYVVTKLACEICEAERAQEQRREYMTSKWDELVQPIF